MNVNKYTEKESLSLFVASSKKPIPKCFFGFFCVCFLSICFLVKATFFPPQAFDWYCWAAGGMSEGTKQVHSVTLQPLGWCVWCGGESQRGG